MCENSNLIWVVKYFMKDLKGNAGTEKTLIWDTYSELFFPLSFKWLGNCLALMWSVERWEMFGSWYEFALGVIFMLDWIF